MKRIYICIKFTLNLLYKTVRLNGPFRCTHPPPAHQHQKFRRNFGSRPAPAIFWVPGDGTTGGGRERPVQKKWRFFGTGAVIEPRPKILLYFRTFHSKILPKFQNEISPTFWERNFSEISRRNMTEILERTFDRYFGRGCMCFVAATLCPDLSSGPPRIARDGGRQN